MEVHSILGHGFLEPIYQEAFEIELQSRDIPYDRHKPIHMYYKDQKLTKYYVADFLCFQDIIVEIKATNDLSGNDTAQLINYLKATKTKVGLLINFGTSELQYKRFVF